MMINVLTFKNPVNNNIHFGARVIPPRKIIYGPDSFERTGNFEKYIFNYCDSSNAKRIEPYTGPKDTKCGISTEEPDLGGGWLISDVNTPLSTTGVRTCAVLNLVDDKTNMHTLYHVFHNTNINRIIEFIASKFPHFNRVNIVGGSQYQTVYTMSRILDAVNEINPGAEKTFYYTVSDNPELVAYKRGMYYMKGKSGKLSFVRNKDNYWY